MYLISNTNKKVKRLFNLPVLCVVLSIMVLEANLFPQLRDSLLGVEEIEYSENAEAETIEIQEYVTSENEETDEKRLKKDQSSHAQSIETFLVEGTPLSTRFISVPLFILYSCLKLDTHAYTLA
jgi:hypothetical protein